MGIRFAGTAEHVRAYLQALVDAGANYVLVSFPGVAYDQEPLYRFADEVIPFITDSSSGSA
jgi:hypothetical protein